MDPDGPRTNGRRLSVVHYLCLTTRARNRLVNTLCLVMSVKPTTVSTQGQKNPATKRPKIGAPTTLRTPGISVTKLSSTRGNTSPRPQDSIDITMAGGKETGTIDHGFTHVRDQTKRMT